MLATYQPSRDGMRLNVREQPNYGAEVVKQVEAGLIPVERVERGWAKVSGGWIDAGLLIITDGQEYLEPDGEPDEEEPSDEPAEDARAGYAEERARLRRMTVAQLTELAQASDIEVPEGAKKEDIINAIISAD